MKKASFYSLLVSENVIRDEDLRPFFDFSEYDLYGLVKNKFQISEERLSAVISNVLDIPFFKLNSMLIDKDLISTFNTQELIENRVIPVYVDNDFVCFAVDNPFNSYIGVLGDREGRKPKMVLVSSSDMNNYFGVNNKSGREEGLLDNLLRQAIDKRASDIHVNKQRESIKVSFRVNGELHCVSHYYGEEEKQLSSLIKLHAQMDISLVNKPQDGRISFIDGNGDAFDIRVSSLPTVYGEDFVFRLFDKGKLTMDISKLGFLEKPKSMIHNLLEKKSGLILVTGSTGSGKTTTLYAFLDYLLQQRKANIVTLEDPIEAILEGVRQSQVNHQIGYDFIEGLRSILRQDPDVLMIGEIRDQETAKIALQAAYTGHLVLSTLHTSDCQSTLFRLQGFQLDPFLVAQTLRGIISQKLVLKLCSYCSIEEKESVYLPNGCEKCFYTGYDGRMVLSEVMELRRTSLKENENIDYLMKNSNHYSFEKDLENKMSTGLVAYRDVIKENVF
jgi:type IV pilus assembly protein PilB